MSERIPKPYIVGPLYDWVFFLLPPLVSLALGIFISGSAFSHRQLVFIGVETTGAKLAIGVLTHAHLVAVFFRSHGNPAIRRLYPLRFFLIPVLLFLAIRCSAWVALTSTVVAVFWDVWHSGAQTFGFARIYDRNAGNPPALGRRLDYFLNQLLYAGPILGGITLVDHMVQLGGYQELGTTLFVAVPLYAVSWRRYLTLAVLAVGTLYLLYYIYAYIRYCRRGYRIAPLKIFLVVTTGACSIYSWGLNSWGEAFFIMNLFHAVQYLALVWATELRQRSEPQGKKKALVLASYLGGVLAYGLCAELVDLRLETLWSITMVVALLHFWYDGFIWSVAKRQI